MPHKKLFPPIEATLGLKFNMNKKGNTVNPT